MRLEKVVHVFMITLTTESFEGMGVGIWTEWVEFGNEFFCLERLICSSIN